MVKEPLTTAESLEAIKRAFSEAFGPPALRMLRLLMPLADFLDRHPLPRWLSRTLYVVTWPGRWLPWVLGMNHRR